MTRQFGEIWEAGGPLFPWRAQMKNYVARFKTEEQAKQYVTTLKKIEERNRK